MNTETNTPPNELSLYTVYRNPSDYPGYYVVRRFIITKDGPKPDQSIFMINENINTIRDRMSDLHLVGIPRQYNDDPCIVESYI